ncbi:MAG: oxidoreductase [Spirochaetales bacterium]|nr:oxidoreductase [Spirochaetales bacterium]
MIKFSVVGCGRIFKKHLNFFETTKINSVELISVCDTNPRALTNIKSSLNFKKFQSLVSMLKETSPDVVIILTHSGSHYEIFKIIEKYKKHTIIEKPLALKFDHAKKMINISKKNKKLLFVVKQNRYNLPVVKLKQAIDKNRFGKLILATTRVRWKRDQKYFDLADWRGTKKNDGGIFWNQASHHIDLLIWLVGPVKSVIAKSTKSLLKIETEDTASCIINFQNGAMGIVEATTAAKPKDLEGSISVIGEKGTVIVGGFAVNKIEVWNFVKMSKNDNDVMNKYNLNPDNVYGFGHQLMYEDIVNKLLNKKSNALEGDKVLDSVKIIEAMYKSIKLKKEIFI